MDTSVMHWRANVREALASLAAVRARSFLALFGIVVGIGSVIAMVSTSEIVKEESLKQFRELGTDVLMIRQLHVIGSRRAMAIGPRDIADLPYEVPDIAQAAAWVDGSGEFTYRGQRLAEGAAFGATEAFADINKLHVESGRFVSALDRDQRYCVVGSDVADALRRAGAPAVVGEQIRFLGHLYTIVGVLRPSLGQRFGQPFEPNGSIFVPLHTMLRQARLAGVRLIFARMAGGVAPEDAERAVTAYFQTRVPGVRLKVTSAQQLIERMREQGQLFTLLLGAVGGISLIVGGVGVMNLMLISVSERRGEIGLRRALGARRRDIRRQFVIESMALCLAGGALGVAVGIAAAYGICTFAGWPFFVSATAMVLGVCVSSGVGVFFGIYPAHQAARLDPIAALRT